jgi:hypothetical protein
LQNKEVPLVGAEPIDASLESTNTLRQSGFASAAKSDAFDPTLRELIDAWPKLSQTIKAGILDLVQAAVRSEG